MSSNSTTTLVTFLVRAPPHVRSVKLLGSWDNFSREYGMERDSRMGGGYWKGCHTFTNIICDGQVKNTARHGRDGALKMGGTYWYHYRLDDDVDFYNQAEPSTTSCPFLPGQPVNVLNVPINLPSADRYHRREGSETSITSINQTMNPADKYMNPRPPPRPELPRLTTSPSPSNLFHRGPFTSPDTPPPMHPFHGRSSSHPREVSHRRRFRAGNRSSPDLCASASSQTRSSPFRNAFRNFASSPIFAGRNPDWPKVGRERVGGLSPVGHVGAGRSRKGAAGHRLGVDTASRTTEICSNCSSPLKPQLHVPAQEDVRGRHYPGNGLGPIPRRDDSLPRNEYETHSRLEPKQYTAWPPKPTDSASVYSEMAEPAVNTNCNMVNDRRADQDRYTITCKLDVGQSRAPAPPDLNSKRLPTLPNSPSSVFQDEPFIAMSDSRDEPLDRNILQSRFSESTAASSSPPSSANSSPDMIMTQYPGGSHFSALTTADGNSDAAALSPSSMTSATTFNNDSEAEGYSSRHFGQPKAGIGIDNALYSDAACVRKVQDVPHVYRDHGSEQRELATHYDNDLNISGLYITKPGSNDSSHKMPQHQPHEGSHLLFPSSLTQYSQDPSSPSYLDTDRTPRVDLYQDNTNADPRGMMQEMFDEMSYLANAIQSNGDGMEV